MIVLFKFLICDLCFYFCYFSVCVPGLADFCFPGGVTSQEIPEDDLQSEAIVLLLHGQQYLKKSESSFVFLFTDQESEVYYGVCVHKEELFEEPPQYMRETLVPPQTSFTTTRCYCLITKYPFFRFHFDFLFSLFGMKKLPKSFKLYFYIIVYLIIVGA